MTGIHQTHDGLFHYQVNLEKRVRANHPLRAILERVDFSFVRAEVASATNGTGVTPWYLTLFFSIARRER